jgi:hypothetical protein
MCWRTDRRRDTSSSDGNSRSAGTTASRSSTQTCQAWTIGRSESGMSTASACNVRSLTLSATDLVMR